MANADTARGFVPRRHAGGGVIRASGNYKIDNAYGTSIFTGDAVVLASGYITIALENSANPVGVFAGCQYRTADGETKFSPYWPASTATLNDEDVQAWVYDDPMIVYEVQTETATAYVNATHQGTSYDLQSGTGSTITGLSAMELDLGDTGTGQWKVLGLVDRPGNAVGTHAKVEVILDAALLKS